jgi:hypothetical protein
VEVGVPRVSRHRAIARLYAKCLDNTPSSQRTIGTLAAQLTEENVEAVTALDLYSQYDEYIAERDRRQRLILAWEQARPTGRLQ